MHQRHLRLTHSDLDFWVNVTVHERDQRYMATADLVKGSRDVGTGDTPQKAVRAALRALGEPYASEMAAGVARMTAGSARRRPRPRTTRPGQAVWTVR